MNINLAQARAVLELTLAAYSEIRGEYWARVYDAVYNYLMSDSPITVYKNEVKRAMAAAFNQTGDVAYEDGGGRLPKDDDTQAWLAAEQASEFGYIDVMFQNLKMLRGENDTEPIHEAFARADGYAKTLDRVYANVKAMAAKTKMLTFVGSDGQESCADCRRYKNKRYSARWWVAHDAVPPSRSFECKGYRCQHVLVDDNGMLFSI